MADEENWSLVLPGLSVCVCVFSGFLFSRFLCFFGNFVLPFSNRRFVRIDSVEFEQKPKLFRFQTNGDSNYTIDFETLL